MKISHIRYSVVKIPGCNLTLNNILYVPNVRKKYHYVHILAKDNYKYLEFDYDVFFINDMSGAPSGSSTLDTLVLFQQLLLQ